MKVTPIGWLHFLVSSRSRWEEDVFLGEQPKHLTGRIRLQHLVDLEYQEHSGRYFCSCERFNESSDYHGEPCHHIEAAISYVHTHYRYPHEHEPAAAPTKPALQPKRQYVLVLPSRSQRADAQAQHRSR